MNKPVTQNEMTAARALAGRVSPITGSASGISLGIARALAAAGSAVVLNGFGNPDEISATNRHRAAG
jgi:3-hydroxybutyrate dehydrogenase